MSGLNLDFSMTQEGFEAMNSTYRAEGLSVGSDHMRLFGEEIQMEVNFSDLILGNRIGQGACSSVHLARHRRTGETYAIKMFNVYDKGQASQLFNEIMLLTSFQCDALITLKGAFHDEGAIGVIIEYMDMGSLDFLTKDGIEMNEQVMAAISFQIIWGLGYLHYEKQIHRDIKPGNILMNSLGQVKLSDFGISKELDNPAAMSLTAVGSYRYMSPERLRGDKYDATGDIWSVGITILELWNKQYPFIKVADTPISLLGELENIRFDTILHRCGFSTHMTECLLSMLAMDASQRITSEQLMGSPWFEYCGVRSLLDAHHIVAHWLHEMERKNRISFRNTADSNSIAAASASAGVAAGGGAGVGNLNSSLNNSMQRRAHPSHLHGGVPLGMSGSLPNHHGHGGSRKDANEMSISMEYNRDENLSASRDKLAVSNNPYTSSGNLTSSLSMAERYRMQYDIGKAPTEDEYDNEDFEEDVVDVGDTYDYKHEDKYPRSNHHRHQQQQQRDYNNSNNDSKYSYK